MKRKRPKYKSEYPHLLYTYFIGYDDPTGAPSLSKFARSIGLTVAELNEFRERHSEFERACVECNEIRRDYLIDHALCKRFDASFTKFILTEEYGIGEEATDKDMRLTLEVVGEQNGP